VRNIGGPGDLAHRLTAWLVNSSKGFTNVLPFGNSQSLSFLQQSRFESTLPRYWLCAKFEMQQ
jgi:hypothetical protein